ncbi:ABC transporter substrate-binding protein [Paenibacillus eucommiae]|uniref:ABC-type glycerol-3-phosphate transport system substrate-binding protein n=1 Tax=Paenibacillus eucommiae TaxID=1355755 RepID=A0ABS4IXZ0_9BACL|nr:sugar ABC transporter substrate-binding protein [Paenibacillus eucommiae]MBP1991751.1 ABC-type glycerol-3-phosphate transport system substrate-binding protein [Paenibacillus eucommiae]
MKKKVGVFKILTAIALIAMLFTACTGNNAPNKSTAEPGTDTSKSTEKSTATATPQPDKKPVTIRVGVIDDPSEKANVQAVADIMKKDFPHITVKIEPYIGDMKQKALLQAASGDLPDVTWLADGYVKEFAEAGILEPLNDYIKQYDVDISDIYPAMLSYGKVGETIYMLPRDNLHMVMAVNTTLLKQEGLSLPSNDWDWATFLEYAKKLTKKDASGKTTQWAVSLQPVGPIVWGPCAQGRGVNYLNKEAGKIQFSDPKVVQGLTDCWSLVKDGMAVDPFGQYPEDPFYAGQAAFMVTAKWAAEGINNASIAKGFEWDVTTFPKLPGKRAVGSGTSGYSVYAKSKHKEEAAAFVTAFVKKEGQEAFMKVGNGVPILMSMKDSKGWQDNPVPGKNVSAYTAFPEDDALREHELAFSAKKAGEINSGVLAAYQKYMEGTMSLDDSLKELDERVNAME